MLQITAKTDYGLLLMAALAHRHHQGPVSLREIADEFSLPYRFLTQIVIPLRQANLIEAREGVRGGYLLTRDPSSISVADVMRALEGELGLVRCMNSNTHTCQSSEHCVLPPFWNRVSDKMGQYLNTVTVADVAAEQYARTRS